MQSFKGKHAYQYRPQTLRFSNLMRIIKDSRSSLIMAVRVCFQFGSIVMITMKSKFSFMPASRASNAPAPVSSTVTRWHYYHIVSMYNMDSHAAVNVLG